MKTFEIRHRYTGLVLFEVKSGSLKDANLRYANLRDADLRGANLRYANLRDADLRGADLRGADLRGADLRGANLRGANLRDADVRNTDLEGAIWNCDGVLENGEKRGRMTKKEIKTIGNIFLEKYPNAVDGRWNFFRQQKENENTSFVNKGQPWRTEYQCGNGADFIMVIQNGKPAFFETW